MKTAVMTDTNSGMSVAEGKKLGIYVLPMPVIIEGESYLEGETVTHAQLYEALKAGKNVSSSQPSPGSVMGMWDQILEEGYDEIIYIPMSSGLSGSCHSAMSFAEEYQLRVQVADNHRISETLAEAVLDAKFLADQGNTAKQIKERLEVHAYDASIYISVNSLEYLKRSGRITPTAAAIATVMNIKPVLTIQGGKLDSFAKVRGMHQSEKRMIDAIQKDWEERFSDVPKSQLRIATAGTFEKAEDAERWRGMLQSAFPDFQVKYTPLSCSIASHTGIDAAGTAIIRVEER